MLRSAKWAVGLLALLWSCASVAQSYPTKPVRIIVPYQAGQGTDVVARYLADQLSRTTGQRFYVENKPGAGGNIGAEQAAHSEADGYTIFLSSNTHMAVNPSVVKDIPYDALKDFKPVTGLARGMMIFVAPPNSRITTVAELVSTAKSTREKLNVGTYTAGFHLSAEWFASAAGTKFVNVPYKGAPEVFNALMGNQLDWAVSDLIAAMPQVKGGKLRGVAVSGAARHADYPDIPTIKESGYPDYVNYTWTSMYIRSETPEAVTNRLVEAMRKILTTPAAREFIAKIGSEPMALAPAEMRQFQISETERYRRIADSAGIKPQ